MWGSVCASVHVCMCTHMSTWSSVTPCLIFVAGCLSEPGAQWLGHANWPVNPRETSVSASSVLELWAVSTLACFVLMWFWEVLILAWHMLCLLGHLSGLNFCFGYWTQVLMLVHWALYSLSHSPSLWVFFICFVETGSHVAQIGLKLLL